MPTTTKHHGTASCDDLAEPVRIYKPTRSEGGAPYVNDTFLELLDLWQERGYCRLEPSPDHCAWLGEVGDVLLYHRPTLDALPYRPGRHRKRPRWTAALLANAQDPRVPRSSPWIFWPRRPRLLQARLDRGLPSYEDRHTRSLFLGRIENARQRDNRLRHGDWASAIDLFRMPVQIEGRRTYPYTQHQYLDLLAHARLGLCLPGFGPKCNREIELLALGVVPVITPGVCTNYYRPLREGVHYFRAENPQDARRIIRSCSPSQWQAMSRAGRAWYDANCSVRGSFETTIHIASQFLSRRGPSPAWPPGATGSGP